MVMELGTITVFGRDWKSSREVRKLNKEKIGKTLDMLWLEVIGKDQHGQVAFSLTEF